MSNLIHWKEILSRDIYQIANLYTNAAYLWEWELRWCKKNEREEYALLEKSLLSATAINWRLRERSMKREKQEKIRARYSGRWRNRELTGVRAATILRLIKIQRTRSAGAWRRKKSTSSRRLPASRVRFVTTWQAATGYDILEARHDEWPVPVNIWRQFDLQESGLENPLRGYGRKQLTKATFLILRSPSFSRSSSPPLPLFLFLS